MSADTEALALMAGLVMEDGRRFGEIASPFQWEMARWFFDPDGPPFRWESRPRGGSKSTDIAGLLLVAMVTTLPAGSRCYVLAADKDQAALVIDAAAGFVARTPALSRALTVTAFRVTARSGSTLDVLAADAASAWGLRPAVVVLDELCQWRSDRNAKNLWQAISSAMGKVKGARLICATTSGDPAHWTHPIYSAAQSSPRWSIQDVPGPLPWVSSDFLREQRGILPESVYARLHENRWMAAEDRLTNRDDVRACVCLPGPLDPMPGYNGYVVALDIGVTNDRTVAAVMHSERENDDADERLVVQRHVLDRLQVWTGTKRRPVDLTAVEEWVATAARVYRARVISDPWQAKSMIQRLREQGVPVKEYAFSQQSAGRLAMTLHTVIRDHRLAIPDDPDLIDELLNVQLRETAPNVFRIDHDPDKHDDRAVCIGMGLVELTATPPLARPFFFSDETSGEDRTLAAIGRPDLQQPHGSTFVGSFVLNRDTYEPGEVGGTKRSPYV